MTTENDVEHKLPLLPVDIHDYNHIVTTSDDESSEDDDDDDDDNDNDDSNEDEDDDDDDDDGSIDEAFIEKEEKRIKEKESGLFLSLEMVALLRASTSDGNINTLIEDETLQKMIPRVNSDGNVMNAFKSSMVHSVQTKSPINPNNNQSAENAPKPFDHLLSILKSNGITTVDLTNNDDLNKTYVKGCVAGYTLPLTTAVRRCDILALREMKDAGKQKTFQCCNQFGESIIHAAARQGSLPVLEFLFNEAKVSCRVRCDTGRTPLHDACWTSGMPKFESIKFLLELCPEFLLVRDNRKYTPLDYAPRETYGVWKEFLDNNQAIIVKSLQKYENQVIDCDESTLYEI